MVMMMMVVMTMMVVMIMILLCFSRRDFESVYLLVRGVKLRIYSRPMVRLILPVLKYACEGEGSQPPRQRQRQTQTQSMHVKVRAHKKHRGKHSKLWSFGTKKLFGRNTKNRLQNTK